jgi:hypothetical protein
MHKCLKTVFKTLGYFALYCVVPIARAKGLDFGDLETDIEDTIVNGKKIVVMVGFAGTVLIWLFTRNFKVVAGMIGLVFFAAQGLEIALNYVGV